MEPTQTRHPDPRWRELMAAPAAPPAPEPAAEPAPPWIGPVHHRAEVDMLWLAVASAMLLTGLIFFGWRGMLGVSCAALTTLASYLLAGQMIQRFRRRHTQDSSLYVLSSGLLLGLALPVFREPMLPILGGLFMGVVMHVFGRTHTIRLSPLALTIVLLWLAPAIMERHHVPLLERLNYQPADAVLRSAHLILGDVYDTPGQISQEAWWRDETFPDTQAMRRHRPAALLAAELVGILQQPQRLVDMLSRGELARLEELLFGCVPGPIGASSTALLIMLGLYLMYRKVSWWPAAAVAVAAAAMVALLLPVRVGGDWAIAAARLGPSGPAVAITYLTYTLLASHLLLIVLILAPMSAPMGNNGKYVYGLIIGIVAVLAPWLLGAPEAAFLGLLLASAASRPLDRLRHSRFAR